MRARLSHRTHELSPSWTLSKVRHSGFRCHPSLVAQTVKNLPAMQKIQVRLLGREDPLEEGMSIHSSILAWRAPWTGYSL